MKILNVGPDSVHVSSYMQYLSKEEKELSLLTETEWNVEYAKEQFIISFRSLNPLNILRSFYSLKRLLRKLKPDVVHIHQVNRVAYFMSRACKKMNVPCVITAWGSDVLLIPQQNTFYRYLTKKSLHFADCVTADSKDMIQKMQELAPAAIEKYPLLQYGIDEAHQAQKEMIIYSNRLHLPNYRIDQVIRYFHGIHADHPEWRLVIGANGTETEGLEKLVKELSLLEKVEFVGWQDPEQNKDWYARSSIFISIPQSDGTSVSLLEAMLAGCIPVVPDLDVSKEWIEDGRNGVIEKMGDNPLGQALKMDRKSCAEINIQLVNKTASRAQCIATFREIYRKSIAKHPM